MVDPLDKISKILIKTAEKAGVEFTLQDHPGSPQEFLAKDAAMPLFMVEAKELYEKIHNNLYSSEDLLAVVGRNGGKISPEDKAADEAYLAKQPIDKIFPVGFSTNEESMLDVVPFILKDQGFTLFEVSHFSHYVLEEYIKYYLRNRALLINGRIPLEPLYEKMNSKLKSGKLKLVEKAAAQTHRVSSRTER